MRINNYKCCICHKELDRFETIRINECLYGTGRYNQFSTERHYDFCEKCYNKIRVWIKKHSMEE